ncbi:MAG: hypothetical protein R2752_07250 [Vicinamibacterales bacterium]
MQNAGNLIRFSSGTDFALIFDRVQGTIASYTYRRADLDRGPLPDFWRAMTDNDFGAWKSVMNGARQNPGARHHGLAPPTHGGSRTSRWSGTKDRRSSSGDPLSASDCHRDCRAAA